MNAPRALLLAPMMAATILMGCAAGTAVESNNTDDGSDAISSLGGPISRDEVLARAQNWVNWGVMYSQDQSSPYQDGDGHDYRRDCSGYVSMVWHLPKKSDGWDFNTGDFGSTNLKTVLGSYDDLEAGDALDGVSYGHIVIFDKWVDSAKTEMWIYQESDYGIPAEHVQRGVSWYHDNGFEPIRYVRIDGGGDPPPPPPQSSCGVQSDGKLHCDDTPNSAMYASMSTSSSVVNTLRSSNSWFTCWGTGELHAGGNTTWYYTEGDDNSSWGWVPAVDLSTTSDFDSNPSAHGLMQCGGGGNDPPPPPPADDPNCDVHNDGKLYCGNTSGAPLHSAPTNGSGVVNYLRSTDSWFTCWKTGDMHAGGNTTWYYTEGDDNTNWGYVPAVDLDTTSDFDSNPSAHGLAACP